MARTPKTPSIVSGKSVKDILNMEYNEFNKLSMSDLRKVTGRLVSAGNKRLRSFEKANESSPAYREVARSGGSFSTKGKDLNALRSEFTRAKNFLQSNTGTIRGWTETKKNTIRELKKQGVNISENDFNNLWSAYEDLKELSPEVANRALKYSTLSEIANRVKDGNLSPEEIAQKVNSKLSEIYEERTALENDVDGVSGFFEL